MAGGFFDTGLLSNHNHTTVAGDGGVLSNLSVTGTITGTGALQGTALTATTGNVVASAGDVSGVNVHATAGIVNETANASAAAECPRYDQVFVLNLLT